MFQGSQNVIATIMMIATGDNARTPSGFPGTTPRRQSNPH